MPSPPKGHHACFSTLPLSSAVAQVHPGRVCVCVCVCVCSCMYMTTAEHAKSSPFRGCRVAVAQVNPGRVCVYTPVHGDRSACQASLLKGCRGAEGVWRGSAQRSSLPHSRQTYLHASALGPRWTAGGCSLTPSSHLVCHSLSLAYRGSTQPQRIISFSTPFLVSGLLTHQIASSFHVPLLCSSIVLSCLSTFASVRAKPKCVCV